MQRHGGSLALSAAAAHGVDTLFTLSGAHIFPLYDAATTTTPPVRVVDVRHEQTAVFAAEGLARVTRRPGLAAVTAGPGVTNSVGAVTTAAFNHVPLLLLGGRAPAYRWGSGALQELDHPPLLAPVTKLAATVGATADLPARVDEALRLACTPPRGPVFLDVPMDVLFDVADVEDGTGSVGAPHPTATVDDVSVATVAGLLRSARRPLVVLGGDVWLDGAEEAARRLVETLNVPTLTNGMGRGVLPAGHPLLMSRARGAAVKGCDLAVVIGTPLDFRMGYGRFGPRDEPAAVVHVADSPSGIAAHAELSGAVAGPLTATLEALAAAVDRPVGDEDWLTGLIATSTAARAQDADLLTSDQSPIHPARIYGELLQRLEPGAVVIGDGGDFVSFAGRFVEPSRPGRWLDPGPFGCLGTGLGYAIAARIAHPSEQVVLMLGDGAAGFSLMDVDTLVRHRLPVVMIVGNNGAWGLELHPMRLMYGTDTAAVLNPATRYDEVVCALGGGGETVTEPADIGPALDRAFASGVPYLVNVVTDPDVAYPRSTTGL